jgi:hypothetical protein
MPSASVDPATACQSQAVIPDHPHAIIPDQCTAELLLVHLTQCVALPLMSAVD